MRSVIWVENKGRRVDLYTLLERLHTGIVATTPQIRGVSRLEQLPRGGKLGNEEAKVERFRIGVYDLGSLASLRNSPLPASY